MASSIEWTNATWNPLVGCTIKSAGCAHCYAMRQAYRLAAMGQERYLGATRKVNSRIVWTGLVTPDESALPLPLHWKKPRMIFVNSMSDLFWGDEEDLEQARKSGVKDPQPVPFEFLDKVFAVMALCPQHTFQVLTKRPARMSEWARMRRITADPIRVSINRDFSNLGNHRGAMSWPLPNVWLGTSVENQQTADARIPHLLRCPAAVRFISYEPALGAVDLVRANALPSGHWTDVYQENGIGTEKEGWLDWVIVGGESGPGARRCHVWWIRNVVRQCKAADVPCFVKQLGANVIDRNDAGFDADTHTWADGPDAGQPVNPTAWPEGPYGICVEHNINGYLEEYQGAPVRIRLRDRKGGDMSEWPFDLRVRQWPQREGVPC